VHLGPLHVRPELLAQLMLQSLANKASHRLIVSLFVQQGHQLLSRTMLQLLYNDFAVVAHYQPWLKVWSRCYIWQSSYLTQKVAFTNSGLRTYFLTHEKDINQLVWDYVSMVHLSGPDCLFFT
jgi:hypothetical protein